MGDYVVKIQPTGSRHNPQAFVKNIKNLLAGMLGEGDTTLDEQNDGIIVRKAKEEDLQKAMQKLCRTSAKSHASPFKYSIKAVEPAKEEKQPQISELQELLKDTEREIRSLQEEVKIYKDRASDYRERLAKAERLVEGQRKKINSLESRLDSPMRSDTKIEFVEHRLNIRENEIYALLKPASDTVRYLDRLLSEFKSIEEAARFSEEYAKKYESYGIEILIGVMADIDSIEDDTMRELNTILRSGTDKKTITNLLKDMSNGARNNLKQACDAIDKKSEEIQQELENYPLAALIQNCRENDDFVEIPCVITGGPDCTYVYLPRGSSKGLLTKSLQAYVTESLEKAERIKKGNGVACFSVPDKPLSVSDVIGDLSKQGDYGFAKARVRIRPIEIRLAED